MRILIVDDMPERHNEFVKLHGTGNELIHAYSYDEAVIELNATPYAFDLLCLDHDLSFNAILCNPETYDKEKTGTHLAKYIAATIDPDKVSKNFTIVCHSLNRAGRVNMMKILENAGFKTLELPFLNINKLIIGEKVK